MRVFSTLVLAGCAWLAFAPEASADVQISMRDGRVTLSARNATVRQILTEWARVGRTQVVNVERIAGGSITIELTDVPEQDALDTLLRAFSGYMVAPRAGSLPNASQFDRIVVMPTLAAPRPAPSAAAVIPPTPALFGNVTGGVIQMPQEEDTGAAAGVQMPPAPGPIFNNPGLPQGQPPQIPNNPRRPRNLNGAPGPPIFGALPPQNEPQVVPPAPSTPGARPAVNLPGAVSTPGMIAPVSPQPGQIVQPPRRSPSDN